MSSTKSVNIEFLPSDLYTTNRAPNDLELASARAWIHYFEVQQRTSAEEAPKRNVIGNVRMPGQSNYEALKKIVAPIRRLPEDIFRHIFMTCMSPDRPASFSNGDAPVLLSHICSDMRRIALSIPVLWTTIDLEISTSTGRKVTSRCAYRRLQAQKNGLEEWLLRRSGNCPLRISVTQTSSWDMRKCYLQDAAHEIVMVALACFSRWREINISLPAFDETILSFLRALKPEDVPGLCGLSLIKQVGLSENLYPMPIVCSPGLQKIIGFPFYVLNAYGLHVHLSTITHLRVGWGVLEDIYTGFSDFILALRQCISLLDLRISIGGPTVTNTGLCPSIHLPYLQHLGIQEDYYTGLLNIIESPRLNEISYIFDSCWVIPSAVTIMLKKCGKDLTTLSLAGEIQADLLVDALSYCRRLVTLDISKLYFISQLRTNSWDIFLSRFVYPDESGQVMCPEMQYFYAKQIKFVHLETFRHFILRKSSTASLVLAPWKMLKGHVRCIKYHKDAILGILRSCDRSKIDINLQIIRP